MEVERGFEDRVDHQSGTEQKPGSSGDQLLLGGPHFKFMC